MRAIIRKLRDARGAFYVVEGPAESLARLTRKRSTFRIPDDCRLIDTFEFSNHRESDWRNRSRYWAQLQRAYSIAD